MSFSYDPTNTSDLAFSGEWNNTVDMLGRRGIPFDQTRTHSELGTFSATYKLDEYKATCKPFWSISRMWNSIMILNMATTYQNSFISVYGWTVEPLIEYHIVENFCAPLSVSNKISLGTHEIDGVEYKVIKGIRVNKPSIKVTATFVQIFSVRQTSSMEGTVAISKHFELWESLGVTLGKFYDVSFSVEGINNSGRYNFSKLEVSVQ